jgi:hypothetical protein
MNETSVGFRKNLIQHSQIGNSAVSRVLQLSEKLNSARNSTPARNAKGNALTACRKMHPEKQEVSGHDFSRAEKRNKIKGVSTTAVDRKIRRQQGVSTP